MRREKEDRAGRLGKERGDSHVAMKRCDSMFVISGSRFDLLSNVDSSILRGLPSTTGIPAGVENSMENSMGKFTSPAVLQNLHTFTR